MKTLVIFAFTAVSLFSFSGFAQEDVLGTDEQRAAGKKIYDAKCAQCHGYNGDAESVAKSHFRPQPRNFTSATFKFRTTENGQLPTHEDIKRSITHGMPYTGMPAWKNFSDKELDNLAFYIKTFAEDDFKEYSSEAVPVELPDPPAWSDESAKRGRIVFEENQCVDCHGNLGRGDGKSGPTLKDQWEIPIRPADLTKPWTFRGGGTRADIFRTFTTGLDGSPMPAYNIQPPEDQWALVDYVYSLRRSDGPNYSIAVIARGTDEELDVSQGRALFEDTPDAFFPVAGQVIEPGRAFFPGVNAIEVNAVYNQNDIAIMLTWHDMSAETSGENSLLMTVDEAEDNHAAADTSPSPYSDAAAILLPSRMPEGAEKPYFLFGDSKNPMDIWFADLAKDTPMFFIGKGSKNIEAGNENLALYSNFDQGQWTVIFKRSRKKENGLSFSQGQFLPIAFSVWDGFNRERGNKRGVTAWYHIYLEPMDQPSPAGSMAKYGGLTFLGLLAIVAAVRLKNRNNA